MNFIIYIKLNYHTVQLQKEVIFIRKVRKDQYVTALVLVYLLRKYEKSIQFSIIRKNVLLFLID